MSALISVRENLVYLTFQCARTRCTQPVEVEIDLPAALETSGLDRIPGVNMIGLFKQAAAMSGLTEDGRRIDVDLAVLCADHDPRHLEAEDGS